jgi:hypothetical protein
VSRPCRGRRRARTPPDPPDASARIAAAHNKAALIASDCGHADLARTLCSDHHNRYVDRQPWTATEARRALEPLINLARLHVRANQPDTWASRPRAHMTPAATVVTFTGGVLGPVGAGE